MSKNKKHKKSELEEIPVPVITQKEEDKLGRLTNDTTFGVVLVWVLMSSTIAFFATALACIIKIEGNVTLQVCLLAAWFAIVSGACLYFMED